MSIIAFVSGPAAGAAGASAAGVVGASADGAAGAPMIAVGGGTAGRRTTARR